MKNFYSARQGDLLFQEISSLPKELKKKKDNILVHSDSTMHDHTLKQGTIYLDKNGQIYLDLPKDTQVVHTMDHKPLNLPKGKYQMIRQVEYLMQDMVRIVTD